MCASGFCSGEWFVEVVEWMCASCLCSERFVKVELEVELEMEVRVEMGSQVDLKVEIERAASVGLLTRNRRR